MTKTSGYFILFLLWFCLAPTAHANDPVKVGASAPPLALRQVLQAPEGIHGTWDDLKGKAVVIEFWATWCGGCVDNIPHINQLAERYASRPLQFISITDEKDVDTVKQFLARHPIRGWVAFDAEEKTFKKYGIEGRPQTVLVDATGIVRAITNPTSITPQVLEELLAGKPLDFPELPMGPPLGLEEGAPLPLLQVLIRPAAPVAVSGTSPGGVIDKNGKLEVYGETLRQILSEVYEVPENRVDAPEWCSKASYDYSVVTPQHEEALRASVLKQAFEAAFRLKVHKEIKETPVYILRKLDGEQSKLRQAITQEQSSHWSPGKGNVEAKGALVGSITHVAQFVLGKEVFDETGLTGRYDFDLKWDAIQPASLVVAIHDQLGLGLVMASRKLNHLVVDSIEDTKTR